MSSKKLDLVLTDESFKDIEVLSQNLNVSVGRVIGQAVALLKMVQGRKVVLKSAREAVEISNYQNKPQQVDLKK
jgi:hypothetical protein